MSEKYDSDTRALMQYAVEDLQTWMANTGASTTEAQVLSWQEGYIAGINRGVSFNPVSVVEEES